MSVNRFPRWLRICTWIVAVFFSLVVIAWLSIAGYINTHKKEILARITAQLSDNMNGDLTIRDMTPTLWKTFPDISVRLTGISLRDSLWSQHHHDLIQAEALFVQVNTMHLLLHRGIEIKKVTASHGSIYMYTDSTGYTNLYLLKKKKNPSADTANKSKTAFIDDFAMEDMSFTFDEQRKHKLIKIAFSTLEGTMQNVPSGLRIFLDTKAHIYSLMFNAEKGSFVKDKDVRIRGEVFYDVAEKRIRFPMQPISVDNFQLQFAGIFYPLIKPLAFDIKIKADGVVYKQAAQWLTPNITEKLDQYGVDKPLNVTAHIDGIQHYEYTPLIRVEWTAKDVAATTKFGTVDSAVFDGYYTNDVVHGAGHGDENSAIHFNHFTGTYSGIPLRADSIVFINLVNTRLDARFHSTFPLASLNDVLGGDAFSFSKGNATADLHYLGGILVNDTMGYTLDGNISIADGAITYLPYRLSLAGVNGTLAFAGDNLVVQNLSMHTANSSLVLDGSAANFLRFYFTSPDKVDIGLKLRSPQIDLNEFRAILGGHKKVVAHKARNAGLNRVGNQLGNVLEASTIDLDAAVGKIIFHHFVATDVVAKTFLASNGIRIEQVQLRQGGGQMNIGGFIHQDQPGHPFEATANIQHVQVAGIFRGFDNFDQTGIVADNLSGALSATATINGNMTDDGAVKKNSLRGFVNFRLEDGALLNYDPLVKISKFVFKKRNLADIEFKDIHDRLDILGDKIIISPMIIRSTALNLSIQGIYGITKGTDIFMEIPLRNPKETNDIADAEQRNLNKKGLVVYLRGQDGGDNKGVKLSWDPFKKGLPIIQQEMAALGRPVGDSVGVGKR